MSKQPDPRGITKHLEEILDMSRNDLCERWEKSYEVPAPKGMSRRLLAYSAAYQTQVKALGGLCTSTKRKLEKCRPDQSSEKTQRKPRPQAYGPGTRLVREWNGETYTVEILREGYAHNGRLYKSLSEVARAITGARWSGPRFFGL